MDKSIGAPFFRTEKGSFKTVATTMETVHVYKNCIYISVATVLNPYRTLTSKPRYVQNRHVFFSATVSQKLRYTVHLGYMNNKNALVLLDHHFHISTLEALFLLPCALDTSEKSCLHLERNLGKEGFSTHNVDFALLNTSADQGDATSHLLLWHKGSGTSACSLYCSSQVWSPPSHNESSSEECKRQMHYG